MSVRAKFRVHHVRPIDSPPGAAAIDLHPVYDSNPESENAKFYAATPWGSISLGTVNPDAAAQFKPGTEFYVDFTPVSA